MWNLSSLGKLFPSRRATLQDARKILGAQFVIDVETMCRALKCEPVPVMCPIKYSRRALAERDKQGIWVLVPKLPLSLWDLRQRFPEEFCPSLAWRNEESWLKEREQPEYRLINLKPMFVGEKSALSPLDPKSGMARANVVTVAQILLAFKFLKKRRMLSQKLHCGYPVEDKNSDSAKVPLVGEYNRKGMLVFTIPSESAAALGGILGAGVVLCKVPDKK